MLKKLLKKKEPREKMRGLSQREAQVIAPPNIIERRPGEDDGQGGQATDYWVEIGGETGPRYERNLFAQFTGRTTWLGMLDPLFIPEGNEGDVDVSLTFDPMDTNAEMRRLSVRDAKLRADLMLEETPSRISEIQQELHDLGEQMSRLRVNAEKKFNVSMQVTYSAKDPDSLRKVGRSITKRMGSQGITFKTADTKQLEAWRHGLGVGDRSKFDGFTGEMETSNIADLFPFGYGGLSHRTGVILGFDHYNRPVFFDNWDRRLSNYNMVIFGRSGAGKSFGIKTITRRSAIAGIRTAIIEPEREYRNLLNAMKCPYIELSPRSDNPSQLNIYDVEEEENDEGRMEVNLEEAMQSVRAVLYKMIRMIDPEALTGQVKVAFHETLRQLYVDKFGITEDPSSLYETPSRKKQMPTLSDHYEIIKEHPDLKEIAAIIRLYTRDYGNRQQSIFDGPSTVDLKNPMAFAISVADLDEEMIKPIGNLVATKWTWERFAKKNPKQKKRLIVDEAQTFMAHDEEANWFENAYRRARKLNTGMCAVTQGFEVFMQKEQGMGILKNAPTKLLLRQEPIDIEAVQGRFAFSEGEAKFLLSASDGLGILKVDEESTIVQIHATSQEYWLYTTDPNE
mgnify:FL=1